MATILVQGSSEENRKTVEVLKSAFNVVNKKATFTNENGLTSIYDVHSDAKKVGEFTEEEVLKALFCCSHVDCKCEDCPYKKVPECRKQVLIDGAVVVGRMNERVSKQ